MDLFNSYEIAALFRAEQSTIHRRLDKYKRGDKKGGLWDGDIDVPYSPEEIDEMDNDLFLDVAMRGARRTIILATYSKKIDRNSVDVANRLLLAQDQLKRGETEKMWKLNKRWLNFFTSDFVIHLTKILSPFKLKVDAKILVSEALDEGYRDLYKIFVKAQEQQEEDAMAGAVKAAKRRGSWKKKRSKVVGSTVLTEDAESIENTAPESDASTQEGSG
jgi:alkylhydroperoxidase/carboxymuconolactone decarboxylase family protein YurZ